MFGRNTAGQPGKIRDNACNCLNPEKYMTKWDCGGNLGPNPSYAARPKSLRYCMGLL